MRLPGLDLGSPECYLPRGRHWTAKGAQAWSPHADDYQTNEPRGREVAKIKKIVFLLRASNYPGWPPTYTLLSSAYTTVLSCNLSVK